MMMAVLLFMNVAMTTTRLDKINITSNLKEQKKKVNEISESKEESCEGGRGWGLNFGRTKVMDFFC